MKALSVRQPWAWAIIYAGKDVENRSAASLRHMSFAGADRIAIHASKGMKRLEYEEARDLMRELGIICPPAADLKRGGIIGTAAVSGTASDSESPWFFGPRGIILRDPEPCEFVPSVGQLGLFDWRAADLSIVPVAARWMLAAPADAAQPEETLFS